MTVRDFFRLPHFFLVCIEFRVTIMNETKNVLIDIVICMNTFNKNMLFAKYDSKLNLSQFCYAKII